MKTYKSGVVGSILAAAALATRRFIGFDGNLCGAAAKALGVSEVSTAIAEYCPVVETGEALVESGGILAIGDPLVSDSTGRAVKATIFAAAAPAVDATKLSVASGATPMTSTAANGAVIASTTGFLTAPVLTGSTLPQAINGYAMDVAGGAGEFVRVKLV